MNIEIRAFTIPTPGQGPGGLTMAGIHMALMAQGVPTIQHGTGCTGYLDGDIEPHSIPQIVAGWDQHKRPFITLTLRQTGDGDPQKGVVTLFQRYAHDGEYNGIWALANNGGHVHQLVHGAIDPTEAEAIRKLVTEGKASIERSIWDGNDYVDKDVVFELI